MLWSVRGRYSLPPLEAAARSFKVEPIASPVHSDAEIETVMTLLGREPEGGLVTFGILWATTKA
jgi:putative tryptophan/tyrosine transport system substrate-binding protein